MQKEVISKSPRIIRAEFKVAEKYGQIGFYDTLTPLYASFHEDDQTFSLMWTEYDESFPVFYPTPEPRILPSSMGGEMNWRFPAFSVVDLVELR